MNNQTLNKTLKVLKLKLNRAYKNLDEIEKSVQANTSTNNKNQDYLILKSKIEAYEDVLDIIEGLNQQ